MMRTTEKAIVLSAPAVIPKHRVLSWADTIAYDAIKKEMRNINNTINGDDYIKKSCVQKHKTL